MLYHGSDKEITTLMPGNFVSKHIKDAWKFGYRRAVLNNSLKVFVYAVETSAILPDPNRNGAFILQTSAAVRLITSCATYDSPFKLRVFKIKEG